MGFFKKIKALSDYDNAVIERESKIKNLDTQIEMQIKAADRKAQKIYEQADAKLAEAQAALDAINKHRQNTHSQAKNQDGILKDFIAIDFETANVGELAYPCSMGLTVVQNGAVTSTTNFYINPEVEIAPQCRRVHGITDDMVADAPIFPVVWDMVSWLFDTYPVIAHHAGFDIGVLNRALSKYNLETPTLIVYDTMLICQNFLKTQKCGLVDMCLHFGVPCGNHHSSGDDSEMCARLFLALQNRYGVLPERSPSAPKASKLDYSYQYFDDDDDDDDGALVPHKFTFGLPKDHVPDYVEAEIQYDTVEDFAFEGRAFVLTGQIGDYDRDKLIIIIEERGGVVRTAVSGKTDYLIVGYEDRKLVTNAKQGKSRKIIKAEEVRAAGGKIKILPGEFLLEILGQGV